MQILTAIADMRETARDFRQRGLVIGLVPTMGALHAGHLSLVAAGRSACDAVVVSIFVNPTQFAPGEDFGRYPRTFKADRELLTPAGADILFAPTIVEMYPDGSAGANAAEATHIVVEGVSGRLDGASRPGHFQAVATVVAKLFHIAAPHRAFFGQKDAAQIAVLRKMVRDLDFGVELVVCPIVRDADGLALSSRNRYLTPEQRIQALALRRALRRVEELARCGVSSTTELLERAREVLDAEPAVRLDYLAAVDPGTLVAVERVEGKTLVAVAAFVGTTRLIDNVLLQA